MDVKNYLPTTFKHLTSIVCLCLFVTACGNNDEDEAVNNVPTAEAQTVTTDEDVALDITLSANDADGDALTYAITNPAHGVISGTAPNLTYTPNTNYNGSDTFSFTVNDGLADSDPATVSITIAAVNDAPVATDGGVSLLPGTSVSGTLAASDVDSGSLNFSIVSAPGNGTLTLDDATTGAFTYTLNSTASGDSFTFQTSDSLLDSNIATVTVTGTIAAAPASGLLATAGDQRVTLNWDTVSGADSYNVYWANASGTGTGGTQISGVKPPFYHDGLTNSANYYYVVTAVNAVGESAASDELSAIPLDIRIDSLSFVDPNLEACVMAAASGLTYVHELTVLNCYNKGITDIGGIEYLTSLVDLSFRLNNISDISLLSGLTKITDLDLSGNHITSISMLSSLVELTDLNLYNNNIIDVSPLAGLIKLTKLNISRNIIVEIATLSSLVNLSSLDTSYNNISNLNAISDLTNLITLYLQNNNISDINALSGLTNLFGLVLSGNNISDVSALSNLTGLKALYLNHNNISNIDPLSGLINITNLQIGYNNVSDISVISNMTKLYSLELNSNNISNISPISGLTNLRYLYLFSNNISNLSYLSALINLYDLSLFDNNIIDVSPLQNMTKLLNLHLGNNNIGGEGVGNVDTLTSLTSATSIALSGNIGMSCSELTALIGTLGSPPVDTDKKTSTADVATNGVNCTNP